MPIPLSRTQSLGRFDEQSISRMAIHAHGAPLISIGGRYGNNNNRKQIKNNALRTLSLNEERSSFLKLQENEVKTMSNQIDENSNNNGGETCLPRIIKPRKRRKKDRKPTVNPTNEVISENAAVKAESCSCNLCDCNSWSSPVTLRRSCSDNSSDVVSDERCCRKDVGVIGGDRRGVRSNEWRSLPLILNNTINNSSNSSRDTRKSSLSDSGDSGCAADILSGLNIADDLLAVGRDIFATSDYQLPVCNYVGYGRQTVLLHDNDDNIDANLSEITRKLSETLDLKSDEGQSSSDNVSVLSDSVFSDGVPDLFVNFDSISRNQLFSANNISKLSNLLFVDDSLTSPALVQIAPSFSNNNDNHNNNNNNKNCINKNNDNDARMVGSGVSGYDQPFIFIPDKDRSSEIFKCCDMVWNGIQQN